MFISISGEAGSGKSTLSKILTDHYTAKGLSVSPFSFAGPLKDALCLWMGWDRARLDHDFDYKEGGLGNKLPDDIDDYCVALGMTRREIMQRFGTECMRTGLHNDFWVIMARVGQKRGVIPLADINIIPDARFVNELRWVNEEGGINIRVNRVKTTASGMPVEGDTTLTEHTQHASETQWKTWDKFDYVIVNPEYTDRSPAYGQAVFENRAMVTFDDMDKLLGLS